MAKTLWIKNLKGRIVAIPERLLKNCLQQGFTQVADEKGAPLKTPTAKSPDAEPHSGKPDAKIQGGKEK